MAAASHSWDVPQVGAGSVSDRVIVRSGLTAGERVCLSQIEAVVDGMKVRTVAETS